VHHKPPIRFALSAVAFFPQLWLGIFFFISRLLNHHMLVSAGGVIGIPFLFLLEA